VEGDEILLGDMDLSHMTDTIVPQLRIQHYRTSIKRTRVGMVVNDLTFQLVVVSC
jgi:hypothetical protein